jgi:hypothetical protein
VSDRNEGEEALEGAHAHDVTIVGAGVAGLGCAAMLARAGLRVALVEARDRIGGRVHTLHEAGAPLPVELGAEFVHGGPPELMTLLAAAGATPVPVESARWRATPEGLRASPWLEDDVDAVLGALDPEREPDRSFDDFLAEWRRLHPGGDAIAAQARAFVEGFHAADPSRASERALADETRAAGREGGEDYRIPAGYDRVPAWLGEGLGAGSLHLGTAATAVEWRPGEVAVRTRRAGAPGPTLRSRAAVIALPIAVLAAPAGEIGAVAFEPEPAGKRDALARLATGDARRIVLRFRTRLWEDDALRAPGVREHAADLGFLQADAAAIPVWWTCAPLREPVLTGWLGGPRATLLAGAPDGAVAALALDALAGALRVPRARLDADLEAAHTYDWAADPYARGAYSYALVGAGAARERLAAPTAGTLFWAGEATHATGAAGTVHGALASGHRAANEVLAALCG